MAPRKRVTAPPDRVYKSSIPLKQLKFPEPVKRVKYGKKMPKRISLAGQDTLTQMDFVELFQRNNEDLDDPEYAVEKPPRKRRKTDGDPPSTNSKYHTQTLTQNVHWNSTATEDQEDDSAFDVPSSPRSLGLRHKKMPSDILAPVSSISPRKTSADVHPPQTPQKKVALEIPSSQSPNTPLSSISLASPSRRSPLKEKSTNARVHTPLSLKATSSRLTTPKLKFENDSDIPTKRRPKSAQSHSKGSSPHKTVRFQFPEDTPKNQNSSPLVKKEYSQVIPSQTPSSHAALKLEILDSDAESEIGDQEDEHISPKEEPDDKQPETFYGDIGTETQLMVEGLISQSVDESQVASDAVEDDAARETQESQVLESQRLSTQHMNSMAPRTGDSDVFISMHPQHVTSVVDRTKDHEFRRWPLPPSVSRIWIYETSPTCTLKYMAVISAEKRPNEIKSEDGVGNTEFNGNPSDSSNYAYEILELYELADPLPWSQLHANEWLKSPPSKWSWVRPAVVDRLMANLKPALFIQSAPTEPTPASSSADTEEAEAQLLDTMLQFSDSPTRTAEESVSYEEPTLPNPRSQISEAPRPSQASTASCSEPQSPRSQPLAEVVWESPSRPVRSSTPKLDLPTPRKQDYQDSDSIVPYSLDSSQLLTKSQMLPASLLSDSVPAPHLFIQDSEDEDY
jgi:hypothetical protein